MRSEKGGPIINIYPSLTSAVLCTLLSTSASQAEYVGRSCEIDNAYTETGKAVYGAFYMYSEDYGEADGAYTEDGDAVYGECYRYSANYCEMDGAYTDSGESVSGECNIY